MTANQAQENTPISSPLGPRIHLDSFTSKTGDEKFSERLREHYVAFFGISIRKAWKLWRVCKLSHFQQCAEMLEKIFWEAGLISYPPSEADRKRMEGLANAGGSSVFLHGSLFVSGSDQCFILRNQDEKFMVDITESTEPEAICGFLAPVEFTLCPGWHKNPKIMQILEVLEGYSKGWGSEEEDRPCYMCDKMGPWETRGAWSFCSTECDLKHKAGFSPEEPQPLQKPAFAPEIGCAS